MCSDAQIFIFTGFSVRTREPATIDSVTTERGRKEGLSEKPLTVFRDAPPAGRQSCCTPYRIIHVFVLNTPQQQGRI